MYSSTSCPLSSRTRNCVPGRASTTTPSARILSSSFAISPPSVSLAPQFDAGSASKIWNWGVLPPIPNFGISPLPFRGGAGGRDTGQLLHILRKRAPLDAANRLLAFHAALLALGDVPALAAHRAQHAALDDLLAE